MTLDEYIATQDPEARELTENPHLADWVNELRNGQRQQGIGAMRTEEGTFCCMGVACDMASVELVPVFHGYGFGVPVDDVDGTTQAEGDADLTHMPTWLRELLGLSMEDEEKLSELNDTERYTFSQIADVVEIWFRLRKRSVKNASYAYQRSGLYDQAEQAAEMSVDLTTTERDAWLARARYLGADAALAAASWIEMTEDDARSILDDVDPEVMDRYPEPDLSGEFADNPTPDSLTLEITGLSWQHERDDLAQEIAEAWEAGRDEVWGDALQAHALRVLGDVIRALEVEQRNELAVDALRQLSERASHAASQ